MGFAPEDAIPLADEENCTGNFVAGDGGIDGVVESCEAQIIGRVRRCSLRG